MMFQTPNEDDEDYGSPAADNEDVEDDDGVYVSLLQCTHLKLQPEDTYDYDEDDDEPFTSRPQRADVDPYAGAVCGFCWPDIHLILSTQVFSSPRTDVKKSSKSKRNQKLHTYRSWTKLSNS